jgi:adenine-specific DNA-methyltransferase
MIKYLGSKRQLIPQILEVVRTHCPEARSVLDLFSGTSRVGKAFKGLGYQVFANDHNHYAFHLARCYVATDKEELPENFAKIIEHLNGLKGIHGFFTENYSLKSRFFHPKNGERIDAIRLEIENLDINEKFRSVLLVSLMEAADRVDSTCGIQMAYLKEWAARALKPLNLRIPDLVAKSPHGKSEAFCSEALIAAKNIVSDVAYLDPPYNQHSYRSNYHIWETLVENDSPALYGTALKRIDCQNKKSDFNSKKTFYSSLLETIKLLQAKSIVLSFNNEGFITDEEIYNLLKQFGRVKVYEINYRRYVGAQIGIYNPKGVKVGNIKSLHNKEFLYVLSRFKS